MPNQLQTNIKSRSWFIELFRFILIILLIFFHIHSKIEYWGDINTAKNVYCFFNGWDITIVCLMLITGYYTCGKNNKNICVRSILTIFFYFILIFCTLMIIKLCHSKSPPWWNIFNEVWVEWWYITLWPLVLILSPLLSKIVNYDKLFSLIVSLIIWFIATTHPNSQQYPPEQVYVFNNWGTVYLFLLLCAYYCFGGWIKRYVPIQKKWMIFLSGCSCLLFYLLGALCSYFNFAYSPYTIDKISTIEYYTLWVKLSIVSWQGFFPFAVGFLLTIFIFSLEQCINSPKTNYCTKFQSSCLFLGKCSTTIYLIHFWLAWYCVPDWFSFNNGHVSQVFILLSLSIAYALIVTYPIDKLIKFTQRRIEKFYNKQSQLE